MVKNVLQIDSSIIFLSIDFSVITEYNINNTVCSANYDKP
nr:MAG TPA: hypothetical protein [Caudoviricetes sp.]